jgi:hypothetical protein
MEGLPRGTEYLSWKENSFVWAKGSASFPKGKDDLYRVVHERGEFVAHGSHLVFCSDRKYRRVDELEALGIYALHSPVPPSTTSVSFQIKSLEDDDPWAPDWAASSFETSILNSGILAIEKCGVDWYWDVQVPITNNYFSGGAIHHNSGKTSAAIQEIKTCLVEHPGSVWVVGRKFLPSLKDTTMRAFLSLVPHELVASFNKAALNLILRNGSEVWFRPLYDPEVLKSYEIAGFMIDEANEIDKEIYDRLKDRMRQKLPNGKHPRYQSIICLNPTEEDHWIPQLFLHEKPEGHEMFSSSTYQNMRNLPPEYVKELERTYSKDMLQRLLYGQFGKVHKGRPVFPQFARGNYIRPVSFNPKLPLVRGWDFGYNSPACVFLQMDQGRVSVLGEVIGKRIYLDDFVRDMVLPYQAEFFKNPLRVIDYCDPKGSDQSDKGKTSVNILNDLRIFPIYRKSFIKEGVAVIKRLLDTVDPNGNPNFLVHPRARVLIEALRGGYHRIDGSEEPEKDGYYDHCFAAGTLITTSRGLVPIENVTTEDRVLTRRGLRKVLRSWQSGVRPVVKLSFSDGRTLTCTPDHKIWTENRGFVEAVTLTHSDTLVIDPSWRKSFTREQSIGVTQCPIGTLIGNIIGHPDGGGSRYCFIGKFGKILSGRFQRAITSITRMGILPTMPCLISNVFQVASIMPLIEKRGVREGRAKNISRCLKKFDRSQKSGTHQKMGSNGIRTTIKSLLGIREKLSLPNVSSVESPSWWTRFVSRGQNFVVGHAGRVTLDVGTVRLVGRSLEARAVPVFDLTVEDQHEFFANGILVHNCVDSLRYSLIHMAGLRRAQIYQETSQRVYIHPRTGRRIEF